MSTTAIEVHAWRKRVGVLAPDPKGSAYVFRYYPSWIQEGIELAPTTMPLAAAGGKVWSFPQLNDSFKRLPPLIADALPDRFGNTLIDHWMSSRGIRREAITELDRLAYMGDRGMGALEFQPANGPAAADAEVPIALKNLVEEARLAVQGNIAGEKAASSLRHIISVGTSAGGARAKAVVAWNPDSGEVRSGQFRLEPGFSHWLIKFDGVGKDIELGSGAEYGRIEYAYHLMAKDSKISMSECRLLEEGPRAHFMTRRFDREGNRKHHVQTLAAMAQLSHELKAAHAYEQYFMVVRDLKLGDLALKEAFRRMVFNVIACNNDDHTKNFSFLLREGGAWELAPAYDVTFAFNPDGEWTKEHLMSVNGKFRGIERGDLLTVADRFAVPAAADIIDHISDVVAAWPVYATRAGVMPERVLAISQCLKGIGSFAGGRSRTGTAVEMKAVDAGEQIQPPARRPRRR